VNVFKSALAMFIDPVKAISEHAGYCDGKAAPSRYKQGPHPEEAR